MTVKVQPLRHPITLSFGFAEYHSIASLLLFRPCSAPSLTLLSFSSLPESISVDTVTGELKAVAVFGYGENGEVVVDALLNRGSLFPVKLPNAELLPPSSSASTSRTAPVTILPFCVILICCVASQSLGLIFCFNWKFQLLN